MSSKILNKSLVGCMPLRVAQPRNWGTRDAASASMLCPSLTRNRRRSPAPIAAPQLAHAPRKKDLIL